MLCENTLPVNLISNVSPPILKVKDPDGLLWNFVSMSELLTLRVCFESEKLQIISKLTNKTSNFGSKLLLVTIQPTLSPYFLHLWREAQYQIHSVLPSSKRLTLQLFPYTLIFFKSMLNNLQEIKR